MGQATTLTMINSEKKGFRRSLRKWKDKLKRDNKASSSSTPQSAAAQQRTPSTASPSAPSSPPPDALFKPTTQTTCHSPADPRNFQSSSNSSSPANTLKKLPPNPRRNTAPADYFSSPDATAGPTAIPINTITTTITATSPGATHNRRASRLRLSFSKRSSVQAVPVQRASSRAASRTQTPPLVSPAPSAPNPIDHTDQRATFQYTTAAEIAAQTENVDGDLVQATEVIRRDKPKDWLDPNWRDHEERERQRILEEEEEIRLKAADVNLGRDGADQGPLRKWEWGR